MLDYGRLATMKLNGAEASVVFALISLGEGKHNVSRKDLAAITGLTERTIIDAVLGLEDKGIIVVERHPGKRGTLCFRDEEGVSAEESFTPPTNQSTDEPSCTATICGDEGSFSGGDNWGANQGSSPLSEPPEKTEPSLTVPYTRAHPEGDSLKQEDSLKQGDPVKQVGAVLEGDTPLTSSSSTTLPQKGVPLLNQESPITKGSPLQTRTPLPKKVPPHVPSSSEGDNWFKRLFGRQRRTSLSPPN